MATIIHLETENQSQGLVHNVKEPVKRFEDTPDISNTDAIIDLLFHFHFAECLVRFQSKYEVKKFNDYENIPQIN